jgi:hypothetical protein
MSKKRGLVLISSKEEALFFCNVINGRADKQIEFLALLPEPTLFENAIDKRGIKTVKFSDFWHWSTLSSLEHFKREKLANESLDSLKQSKNFYQIDDYHGFSLLELVSPTVFIRDVYCKIDTYKSLLQIIRDVKPRIVLILSPNRFVAPLLMAAKEEAVVTIFIQISPDLSWQYKNSFYLELFDRFNMISHKDKELLLQLGVPEEKISISKAK